jgi:hypothetical protein
MVDGFGIKPSLPPVPSQRLLDDETLHRMNYPSGIQAPKINPLDTASSTINPSGFMSSSAIEAAATEIKLNKVPQTPRAAELLLT